MISFSLAAFLSEFCRPFDEEQMLPMPPMANSLDVPSLFAGGASKVPCQAFLVRVVYGPVRITVSSFLYQVPHCGLPSGTSLSVILF